MSFIAHENVFTIFLNHKKLFKPIKTNISKSRKIEIFPKGLVHGFGQKLAIFPFYYFRACWPGKCLLRYF